MSPTRSLRWSSTRSAAARRIADLGSGAGFPGLVLAAALPDARVSLVEASAKKCEFLDPRRRRDGPRQRRRGRGARGGVGRRDGTLRPRDRPGGSAAQRPRRVRGAAAREPAARSSRGRGAATRQRSATATRPPPRPGSARRPCARSRPWDGAEHLHLHLYLKVGLTPNRYPAPPGNGQQTAAFGPRPEQEPRGSVTNRSPAPTVGTATVVGDGHRLRDRQPEGRRGQDDDGGQRRRLHRRGRLRDAADRHRPAGQRHARPRPAEGLRPRTSTTSSPVASSSPPRSATPRSTCLKIVPAHPDLAGANVELPREAGLGDAPARRARRRARALRLRPAGLPAVARAADGQRARRRRPRDRPGPDGVLRAGGARGPARHAGARSSASSTRG